MTGEDRPLHVRTCEEARHTVDHHIKRIKDNDQKAVAIFRLNILILGILLTSTTILTDLSIDANPFLNLWSVSGVVALVVSTFFAAITYTSTVYDIGISPEIIDKVASGAYDDAGEFDAELRNLYKEWIIHNRSVGDFNIYLFMFSLMAAFDGIVFFSGGGVIGITGMKMSLLSILAYSLTVAVLILINLTIWKGDTLYARLGGEE